VGLTLSAWVGQLESPETAREREQLDRDLPLALDLLAACSAAGRPIGHSLSVVSRAVGGTLAARFDAVSAAISLGAAPATEWERWLDDGQLGALARTMLRSAESGAPLADGLSRLADDHRRKRRTRMLVRARSVGVRAAGPLAACFLPAFLLIGVVPLVAGGFQRLFA
jgi:pilus assembly protein TadC